MMCLLANSTDVAPADTPAWVLMAVGLCVVFATLAVLALVVAGMGRVLADRAVPVSAAPATDEPMRGGVDPRHLVVIAAAARAAAGGPVRVHRIVMLGRQAGAPWVTEGRVVVMGSHHPHRG